MTRGEVVGAIDDHIRGLDQLLQSFAGHALGNGGDNGLGIDACQRAACGVDLALADRIGEMHDLPLQIGQVDVIVVADREPAHAARRQIKRYRRAEAAGTDDQDMRVEQLLLAIDFDFGQQDVAAVTQ